MDVIKAIQHYADKMINDVPGMKALLLDTETVSHLLTVKKKRSEFNSFLLQDTYNLACDNTIYAAYKRMLPH